MKKNKKQQKEPTATLRERMADSLVASKEVILDAAKLTVVGDREMTVENCKGVVEYTADLIVLEANPSRIEIRGERLEIKSMTKELLYIGGRISAIAFKKGV